MRVLIVNDYKEMGGAEVIARASADALRERGHEVELLAADEAGLRRTPLSYVDSPRARRVLAGALERFRPDAVHIHNLYHLLSPGILATLDRWKREPRANAPDAHPPRRVVMTLHDYHLVCPNAGLRRFTRRGPALADPGRLHAPGYLIGSSWDHRGPVHSAAKLVQHAWNYRICARRRVIDVAIAPSRYLASVAEKALRAEPEAARPRVRVVPNPLLIGPEIASLSGAASGERDGGSRPFTLLFAGRVEPEKGLPAFVRALAGLDGVRVEVVGEGSDLPACLEAGRDAGVEVVAPGHLPHAAALARMAAAGAVALPSIWPENAPVSLFEALALRKPILVSDAGGMREIVDDFRVGARFDPADPEAVRAAVRAVREASVPLSEWERIARMLEDRSPARHAERLERIYAGA